MSQSAIEGSLERGIRPPPGGDLLQAERVQQEVISRTRLGLRDHLGSWKLRLAAGLGGALGLLSVACTSPARSENIQVRPTATPVGIGAELVKTGNAEIDTIGQKLADPQTRGQVQEPDILKWNEAQITRASTTATAEAQKLPAPEAKVKPYECVMFSPELCTQAERVEFTYEYLNPPVTRTFIALNLPEGIPLFSPVDGLLDKVQESGDPFSGLRLTVREGGRFDGTVNPIFRGDIRVDNMLQKNVQKGDIIGYTADTGIRNLGASLLFTITKATPQGGIVNEEVLRELFPAAFEKPVKQTFSQKTPGKPNVSISYSPNPPQ